MKELSFFKNDNDLFKFCSKTKEPSQVLHDDMSLTLRPDEKILTPLRHTVRKHQEVHRNEPALRTASNPVIQRAGVKLNGEYSR